MKNDNYSKFVLLFLIFVAINWFLYNSYFDFINSNYFLAVITLLVGSVAIYLYIKQKIDNKIDAAKIILQEIRRAEEIISSYKEHGHFKFTKKIIATNSWSKNIHYFVDELSPDELDKISNLYSTGEYLDSVIKMVSDTKFDRRIYDNFVNQAKEQVAIQLHEFINKINNIVPGNTTAPNSTTQVMKDGFYDHIQQKKGIPTININVNLKYDSINTDILFMQIVNSYEPIYNSDICLKLKNIAKIK